MASIAVSIDATEADYKAGDPNRSKTSPLSRQESFLDVLHLDLQGSDRAKPGKGGGAVERGVHHDDAGDGDVELFRLRRTATDKVAEESARCRALRHTLLTLWPLSTAGTVLCVRNPPGLRRSSWAVALGLLCGAGFIFHLGMDFYESIVFRGWSTAMCFVVVMFFLLPGIVISTQRVIPSFVELVDEFDEATPGERAATLRVASRILPWPFFLAVSAVNATLWLYLLYLEGILDKETDQFGPAFIPVHWLSTTAAFFLSNALSLPSKTVPCSFSTLEVDHLTDCVLAFARDLRTISKFVHARGSGTFDERYMGRSVETAILSHYATLKHRLRKVNHDVGPAFLLFGCGSVLMGLMCSIALAMSPEDRKKVGILYMLMFLFISVIGPHAHSAMRCSSAFASVPAAIEEVAAAADWRRLQRFFHNGEAPAFRMYGIPVTRSGVVRALVLAASAGATALQFFLFRGDE